MSAVIGFVRARSVLVTGIILGVVALGAGFFWYHNGNDTEALLTVYPERFVQQVSVSGRVVAALDVSLGFTQGGRIERIDTRVGERVRAGEVLAEIESADARALVLQRQAVLAAEEANLQVLRDGARPEEIAVSEAAVQSAEVALAQAEQALVDEMHDAFRAAEAAVRVHVDQFISNPRSSSPTLSFNTSNSQVRTTVENQRPSIEAMLTNWESTIFSLTVLSDVDDALRETKQDLAQVALFLASASAAVNQGVASGLITTAVLDGYAADVAAARSAVNVAITTITAVETNVRSTETALVSAQKSLLLKEAEATASSILAQEAKVRGARASVLDAEAQLAKTRIIAPFDGVVTNVDADAGETVQGGVPVISLISDEGLQIESFVPEINIALLKVGDRAGVTLDAYGSAVVFDTEVVAIDPAETIRDGVSTYRAILEFIEDDPRVKAGMTANITVVTAEKEGVIAVPRGIVTTRDGVLVVPVKVEERIEWRPVETGLVSSLGTIEIISGLYPGDTVVLKQ
jgi:HlyD family secretion protein